MSDYLFAYKSDKIKYETFQTEVRNAMRWKSQHCAPIHEDHWADFIAYVIKAYFTDRNINRIAKELNRYLKEVEE